MNRNTKYEQNSLAGNEPTSTSPIPPSVERNHRAVAVTSHSGHSAEQGIPGHQKKTPFEHLSLTWQHNK